MILIVMNKIIGVLIIILNLIDLIHLMVNVYHYLLYLLKTFGDGIIVMLHFHYFIMNVLILLIQNLI